VVAWAEPSTACDREEPWMSTGPDIPLWQHCDDESAFRGIDRLRAAHPRADPIADALVEAVRRHRIPEEDFTQHSRWCNTGGSWIAGRDPARATTRAMYGFVPERLVSEDGRTEVEMTRRLEDYRLRLTDR
jgi:hypothetical protein